MARGSLGGSRMMHHDGSALTACYHVIAMLEAQLRSAHDLRERLEAPRVTPDHHAHVVIGLCNSLLNDAVASAQAVATLRDVCSGDRKSVVPVRTRTQ